MAPFPAQPQSYQPPPPPQQPPQKSSSGCLKWGAIGCVVILLLGGAFIAVVVGIAFGAIRSTTVYKQARDRAVVDSRVAAALGTPVEAGWWVTGSVHEGNGTGGATIKFPISGPRGKATVDADATLERDSWTYTRLIVHPDHGADIDLLHP
jgi:hypothetical protein